MNESAARWLTRTASAIPLALAVIAEAAWVTVVASTINEYALRERALDIPVMAVFVVAGIAISRVFGLRVGSRWPALALGAIILAALFGVFIAGAARDAIVANGLSGLPNAVTANPGGLMVGMALLRGIAWGHAGVPLPEDRLVRLLGGGLVIITLSAVAQGLATEPWRSPFLLATLGDGLIFAGAAMLALAFTRQAIAAGDVAAGWQRNPTWVVTMVAAVVTLVVVSLAVSGQVRPTIELAIAVLAVPLIVLGMVLGWSKRGLRIFVGILVVMGVLTGIGSVIRQVQVAAGTAAANGVAVSGSALDTAVGVGVAGTILVAIVLIVLILVRLWMRQLRIERDDVVEERYVDRTGEPEPVRARRRRRLPFGRQPADAVSAYRALLDDLADRTGVRRERWETPHEHAQRLRVESAAGVGLNLLAADYALASFGEVNLTAAENRRAVGRWRALRGRLRATVEPEEEPFTNAL